MKNSEIKKLISDYKLISSKLKKSQNQKLKEKLFEIEHRYYHETGRFLKTDLK